MSISTLILIFADESLINEMMNLHNQKLTN